MTEVEVHHYQIDRAKHRMTVDGLKPEDHEACGLMLRNVCKTNGWQIEDHTLWARKDGRHGWIKHRK